MANPNVNPNAVYNALESAATGRVKKTLTVIHQVCKEQQERGSGDFSITTIARIGESSGVPKAQSIRNKTGEPYRALIQAWAGAGTVKAQYRESTEPLWVDNIVDRPTRALVLACVAQNEALQKQITHLKNVADVVIDLRPDRKQKHLHADVAENLTGSEIKALGTSIDDVFLSKQGWERGERGKVIDADDGRTVLPNGFCTAIEKILNVNS